MGRCSNWRALMAAISLWSRMKTTGQFGQAWMVRKGTSRAEALVNHVQSSSKTPRTGHSTKLERTKERFGRRAELSCSALFMINPRPTKDMSLSKKKSNKNFWFQLSSTILIQLSGKTLNLGPDQGMSLISFPGQLKQLEWIPVLTLKQPFWFRSASPRSKTC